MWVRSGKSGIYKMPSVRFFVKGAQALMQSYHGIAPTSLEPVVLLSLQQQQRMELQQQRHYQQQQLLQLVCGFGCL